jgi:hypothetical protein
MTFVSKRLEVTKHILNKMPSSMKEMVTVFCIFLVFYVVGQAHGINFAAKIK